MTRPLSIVLPVWNEEAVIGRLVEELLSEVADRVEGTEIIVVDDASSDGTAAILDRLAGERRDVRVLRLERNRGHGPAVLEGLRRADGDWIFQLDSDGQFVVGDFWQLWRHREEADLVLGVRARRQDPVHRLLLSRVVATATSALVRRRVRDANVPFRILRRELWEDLAPFLAGNPLAPSIHTVVGAVVRGWRVLEVPVSHRPRERGRSSLRAWRLFRFGLRGLAQLLRFRVALARAPERAR